MGKDRFWTMDTEGGVEQDGDSDRAGSENTGHLYNDRLIGVFIGTQTFSVPTSSHKALISG
jgi:hypothetical protein